MSPIANEIRPGNVIRHKSEVWKVVSTEHVKPGKGGAFVQTELKNIKTNSKLNARFRSTENVDRVIFESVQAVFLYRDGDNLEFMDTKSFEQISVPVIVVGSKEVFLKNDMKVDLEKIDDGEIVGIVLPDHVQLKVIETEPNIKHQTITATFKSATLDNGIVIQVPQFIVNEDDILVKTSDRTYLERAK